MKSELDIAIEQAELACNKVNYSDEKLSLVDKLQPYTHLQNLLSLKMEHLINKSKNI